MALSCDPLRLCETAEFRKTENNTLENYRQLSPEKEAKRNLIRMQKTQPVFSVEFRAHQSHALLIIRGERFC